MLISTTTCVIAILIFATLVGIFYDTNIIYNNSTRNYKYEDYCDSVFVADPDYYFDVLVETDEFQRYTNEHGKWYSE